MTNEDILRFQEALRGNNIDEQIKAARRLVHNKREEALKALADGFHVEIEEKVLLEILKQSPNQPHLFKYIDMAISSYLENCTNVSLDILRAIYKIHGIKNEMYKNTGTLHRDHGFEYRIKQLNKRMNLFSHFQSLIKENQDYVIIALFDHLEVIHSISSDLVSMLVDKTLKLQRKHYCWIARDILQCGIEVRHRYWRYPVHFRREIDWAFYEQCLISSHLKIVPLGINKIFERRNKYDHFLVPLFFGLPFGYAREIPRFESLEDITGLRVREQVVVVMSDMLRFQFLFQECLPGCGKDSNDIPEDLLYAWHNFFSRDELSPQQLIEMEVLYDELRDELDQKINEWQGLVANLSRDRREEWKFLLIRCIESNTFEEWPFRDIPEPLQEVANEIRCILGNSNMERSLIYLERQLREASESIYRRLSESGISCRYVFIDGVLGEYSFPVKKIVLYSKMINLVLPSLMQHFPKQTISSAKQYELLTVIVEIHESAHAIFHLGHDTDQSIWADPHKAPTALHETISQFYTWHQAQILDFQEGRTDLKDMFLALNKCQTYPYNLFRKLENMEREEVRHFFLCLRRNKYGPSIREILKQSFEIIEISREVLGEILEPTTLHMIAQAINNFCQCKDPLSSKELIQLWETLRSIPVVSSMLTTKLGRELPDTATILRLFLEDLFRQDQPVGISPRASIRGAKKVQKWHKPLLSSEFENRPIFEWIRHILKRKNLD